MICYEETQLIIFVIFTVIATIVVYCSFIKQPQINYENIYVNKQNEGYSIGGHISAHSSAINAAPYKQSIPNQGFKFVY